MVTLNLVYPEKSDIKFKVSKFPDGQQTIDITSKFTSIVDVQIKARMNSFKDVELILCATAALRNLKIQNISLYIPYFIGGRSDRKFIEGGSNYIKQIIAPIINAQNYNEVVVLDPHSDVIEACINNIVKVDNIDIKGFRDFFYSELINPVLVSPDAGALKKIYNVAEKINAEDVLIASKHRDIKTGKIISTEVPDLDKYNPNSTFIIVDDICDGGRTFIEIAKVIKNHVWPRDEYYRGQIYLIVTHGIFSAGFSELDQYFDKIFTTNSVSDCENMLMKNKLTQLNVF